MTRTVVTSNENVQRWALTADNEWTDHLQFRGLVRHAFSASFEGSFTGTPIVQIRDYADSDGSTGTWVAVATTTLTANTANGVLGIFGGSFDMRAGFTTLSGTPTVTVKRLFT